MIVQINTDNNVEGHARLKSYIAEMKIAKNPESMTNDALSKPDL